MTIIEANLYTFSVMHICYVIIGGGNECYRLYVVRKGTYRQRLTVL